MGHIAHLRKQFKSLDTYGFFITLIMRMVITYMIIILEMHIVTMNIWLALAQWFWIGSQNVKGSQNVDFTHSTYLIIEVK